MKKRLYLIIALFTFSFHVKAEANHFNHIHEPNAGCHAFAMTDESYEVAEPEPVLTSLRSSNVAKDIINNIVNVVGLKPNFEIRAANISNAAAVNYGGKRYILYDPAFMDRIANAAKTDWAAISILAHEIGHHLNGHTTMAKGSEPSLELEADEFSGFVLRKMGASLPEAQRAMSLISNEKGSSTHPKRSLRLAAIKRGYASANDQILASINQPVNTQPEISPEITADVFEPARDKVLANNSSQFPKENILGEVHFSKIPERKFYITKNFRFVEVTEEGIDILGRIERNNNRFKLNIYDDQHKIELSISSRGYLYNSNNSVVGVIKTPIA